MRDSFRVPAYICEQATREAEVGKCYPGPSFTEQTFVKSVVTNNNLLLWHFSNYALKAAATDGML
jgi:hypothetical protein